MEDLQVAVKIQLRRDTVANWISANPILAQGEVGVELDTEKAKLGDGASGWNSLSYFIGNPDLSDLHYTHTQGVASATWVIAHNMGKFPSVTIADSSGRQVEGDVIFNDANQVTLQFVGSFAGIAYLN
jgi:hypothetical protein